MNPLKKLFFYRAYTTGQNERYWRAKTDREYWVNYLKTWNHPHRFIISAALNQFKWVSLFEVGCGSGPNIVNIVKHHNKKQIGGSDINKVAIEVLSSQIKGGFFKVGSGDNIMMSDKSSDVVLSDAYLIYVGPLKIKKYLKEIKRIARNHVVLVEYHSESWKDRFLLRVLSGRHSYNYKKLLERLGFYDIRVFKMPKVEKDNEEKFRHIIIAKTTLRI